MFAVKLADFELISFLGSWLSLPGPLSILIRVT